MEPLSAMRSTALKGDEQFRGGDTGGSFNVSEFWRWAVSNLLDNTTRGVLAEFLVAKALGISTEGARCEWDAHDLTTSDGLKIEVKSFAYLQSWSQRKLATPRLSIRATLAWNRDTGTYESVRRRQCDLYVFAVLAHQDKATVDPLNLDQWQFYVVSARLLDERLTGRRSIDLRGIERLGSRPLTFNELKAEVERHGGNLLKSRQPCSPSVIPLGESVPTS